MKSFYEMLKLLETGATTVAPTPLSTASSPPPSAQSNPTGAQLSAQNAQSKVATAQQKQDQTNKANFIKQLKDLLKRNLGINL